MIRISFRSAGTLVRMSFHDNMASIQWPEQVGIWVHHARELSHYSREVVFVLFLRLKSIDCGEDEKS